MKSWSLVTFFVNFYWHEYSQDLMDKFVCFQRCWLGWLSKYSTLTTRFCAFFGSNCNTFCANKQTAIAHSSVEIEYRSMASTTTKFTWITYSMTLVFVFLTLLHYFATIWCSPSDYKSILPCSHKIHPTRLSVCSWKVAWGTLETHYILSTNQLIDLFTKSLPRTSFLSFLWDKLDLWLAQCSLKGVIRMLLPLLCRGGSSFT